MLTIPLFKGKIYICQRKLCQLREVIDIENNLIQIGEFSVYVNVLTGEFASNEYSYGENKCLERALTEKFKGEVLNKNSLKQVECFVAGYHEGRN